MGIAISAAYDDNIFLSATAPKADFVVKVAPSVAYRKGDKATGEGGYLALAYKPAVIAYADHSDNNRIDHQAAWEAPPGRAARRSPSPTAVPSAASAMRLPTPAR